MECLKMISHHEPTGLDDEEFPPLPQTKTSCSLKKLEPLLPSYHSKITEIVEIPFEERRFQTHDGDITFGRRYDVQSKICMEIAKEKGVEMNLTSSKSHVLAVVISGEPIKVAQAKRRVIAELQQQETVHITVPTEYHGYLIGRKGERLQELESSTMTRISIQSSNSPQPNSIAITGPRRGILEAQQLIFEAVRKQSQQGFERLSIPKIYHPFICGPNNQRLNELKERTETKINIPPPPIPTEEITISGKREGVTQAVKELQDAYKELLETTKKITITVKKSQHRIVVGVRGSGLAAIFEETGVSVEMPSDPDCEEIVLCGKPEDLGRASSMVYRRAQSSVTEEIDAPNRFHKLLIGKRGANLASLLEGYERVQVNFGKNSDKITIKGPLEEVEFVMKRLKSRLAELKATVASATIKVDPKYYRHIIGKQGATIGRLREYKVEVHLPNPERGDAFARDELVIEGDPDGVEKAKAEIQQLVEKLENEKCKDVIIEPRIQRLLCFSYNGIAPPIRTIYDSFPKVSVIWPESEGDDSVHEENPTKSIVQLRGDRQQVDAAAERLNKIIKVVIEENYRQEIQILKEFRSSLFGRESEKVKNVLDETKTRLQCSSTSDGSDIFTVIGREENVHEAIRQLEEMQKKLANVKEIVVSIPSALTAKFAGGQTPSLRSIREQCDGVHIRFSNPNTQKMNRQLRKLQHTEIVILGPEEAVLKAQKLVDELNAKVSEMCSEEIVKASPKFHGILIGRQAVNITQFRKRHNVELIFPDRFESDPELAKEIRIVGSKDSVSCAKKDLESLIKSLEDEIEQSIPVDQNMLKDIVQYRRSFPMSDLEGVRVIMPRYLNHIQNPEDNENHQISNLSLVKVIGSKACVQTAVRAIENMIKDIQEQITQEFPITDPIHMITLERNRSQLPELGRNFKVYIRLLRSNENAETTELNTVDKRLENPSDLPVLGILALTGQPDKINQVYEEVIKPLLPIEEVFPLAQEFHRNLIVPFDFSNTREQLRRPLKEKNKAVDPTTEIVSKAVEIKQKHSVTIRLPPQHVTGSHYIILRGTPSQLSSAKLDLIEWIKQCESLKADRIARNFELPYEFPSRHFNVVLGMRPKLCQKYEIGIRVDSAGKPQSKPEVIANGIPTDGDNNHNNTPYVNGTELNGSTAHSTANEPDKERMTTLILRGYQEKIAAAKQELEELIEKLNAQITENLFIPAEAHAHLIGAGGNSIQKIMRDYKVRIEFPNKNLASGSDPNTVLVTGDEKDVDLACDYLISKANELIARFESQGRNTRQWLMEEEILLPNAQTH